MEALESQARDARKRLLDLAAGARRDRAASVAHAFSTLLTVAPVNAGIAFLPVLLLLPIFILLSLVPVLILGVSLVLLAALSENSDVLNWTLLGTVGSSVFLIVLFLDVLKGVLDLVSWWLRLHFQFLLGDA